MQIEGIVADFRTIIINKDNQRRRDEPLFISLFVLPVAILIKSVFIFWHLSQDLNSLKEVSWFEYLIKICLKHCSSCLCSAFEVFLLLKEAFEA